ncbi:MFS transporter [Kitasatospora sp. NPDC093806]|uniref:MFS transporter n=1 Tax=Kitasatospora sp. NPDC093806 TaxID=3155075 RepID=UPI0034170093
MGAVGDARATPTGPPSRAGFRDFQPLVQAAALIEWTGTGLFLAVSTIYFVQVVGLPAAQVGAGLGLAGGAAMLGTPLVARLAGRHGPRTVLVWLNLLRALATLGYLWVDGWIGFAAVALVVAVMEQSAPPLIQAYVGSLAAEAFRGRVLAAQRTLVNVGISLGGLIAGAVLGADDPGSFRVLLVGGAVSYLLVAVVLSTGRAGDPATRGAGSLRAPARDRRFLALTCYNALLSLWTPVLNVGFPLWLVVGVHAPVRLAGLLYAVNTVLCIALQYPLNRFHRTADQALRCYGAAAGLLALAVAGLAVAPALAGPGGPLLLAGSVVVLTLAELLQVGAAWTLSFELAPADDRSSYLLFFGTGRTLANRVIGPVLMTGVVLALGSAGWAALAGVFAASAAIPFAVLRRRRATVTP